MTLSGILNTARTIKQGTTMHLAKDAPEYLEAIGYVGVNEDDLAKAGISEGDEVTITSAQGAVTVTVKKMEVQPGNFFMPLSFLANRVVSPETHGTGVPSFKNTPVTISKS